MHHEGTVLQQVEPQIGQTRADLLQRRIVEPAGAQHARHLGAALADLGGCGPGAVPAGLVEIGQFAALGMDLQPGLPGPGGGIGRDHRPAPALAGVAQHLPRPHRRAQVDHLGTGTGHAEDQRDAHILGPEIAVIGIGGGRQEVGQTADPLRIELQHSVRQVGGLNARRQLQRPQRDQRAAVIVGQRGAEGLGQGLFGTMARLIEIPVRGRGGGRSGGGVPEGMKPDAILDRDLVEHGFKGGDPGRR